MCRRRPVLAPLAALVLLLPAGSLTGQETGSPQRGDDAEARLFQRLESLRAAMDTLPEPRPGRARGTPEILELDTLVVRGVRVVTPDEDARTVAPWIDDAVARLEAQLGPIPEVADPPTVRVDWRPVTTPYEPADPWTRISGRVPAQVRITLESAVARALTQRLPGPIREWLAGPAGPVADPHGELLSIRSWPVEPCARGDGHLCAVALGLDPAERAALGPEEARQMEEWLRFEPPAQQLPDGRIAFLSPEARRSFLHSLLRSRPGALERLWTAAPDTTDPAALLEQAAGGPLEPFLAEWRDEVLASPPPTALDPSTAAATLAWIFVFIGLATRSTRWRAG